MTTEDVVRQAFVNADIDCSGTLASRLESGKHRGWRAGLETQLRIQELVWSEILGGEPQRSWVVSARVTKGWSGTARMVALAF